MMTEIDIRDRDEQGRFIVEHGFTGSRLHRVWKSMKARCYCKGQTAYRYYGARGIIVCSEWQRFDGFMRWAFANEYEDGLSIERIDPNANYCPENCKWIPQRQQSANRRSCQYITVNGVRLNQSEWARRIGVHHTALIQARNSGKNIELYIQEKLRKEGIA